MSEQETFNDVPECPNCGWLDQDWWETNWEDGDQNTIECPGCDESMIATFSTSVTFVCRPAATGAPNGE